MSPELILLLVFVLVVGGATAQLIEDIWP